MSKLKERTIVQAIQEVMIEAGQPMSAKEIYSIIFKKALYKFKAANPLHKNIFTSQIRRHCKGLEEKSSYSKTKYFYIKNENKYYYLDNPEFIKEEMTIEHKSILDDSMSNLKEKINVDFIEEWFLSEYHPIEKINSISYENLEYIDVFDGLYSAFDAIKDKFWGLAPNSVISQAAEKLEDTQKCLEWAKIPKDRDLDNYYIENLQTNFYNEFKTAISYINKLSRPTDGIYTLNQELEQPLKRMLYANIITAMEAYLSDAFTKIIVSKPDKLRKFVETTKEFQNQKISLSDLFSKMDRIKKDVEEYLIGLPFHRLEKVAAIYKATLDVDFPKDSFRINKAIAIRHDYSSSQRSKK